MAEESDLKNDDGKNGGTKRLTREEYDKLVQGCDDIYFGGVDETEGEKKPPLEKPASEQPKSGNGE
jgi:hypothetical protein